MNSIEKVLRILGLGLLSVHEKERAEKDARYNELLDILEEGGGVFIPKPNELVQEKDLTGSTIIVRHSGCRLDGVKTDKGIHIMSGAEFIQIVNCTINTQK